MSSLDLSKMSASDAVVALASYPRRYRQTVLPVPDDPAVEQLAAQIGPAGHSALDLVVNTTSTWVLLGQSLHRVIVEDAPVLHAAVLDASVREWATPPATTIDAELARLESEADALAAAIGTVHGRDWDRTATVTGGAGVTALDLVHEAVRAGAENLAAITTTLAAVRRSSP